MPGRKGSGYPPPFDAPCAERVRQRLGDAGGLEDFGVNLMRLPPGRLVEPATGGETALRAGDCAAFPKGSRDGHHLINTSSAMAAYLEVGSRAPDDISSCSDIDLQSANADGRFVHKNGAPCPEP